MVFRQILKSWRSQPIENYKGWERFFQMFDYKDVKFPVKVRDIHKIETKRIPSVLVFLVIKISQSMQFMYQKNVANKNMLICY